MPEFKTLVIRTAKSADAEDIANLHALSWQSAYKGMLNDNYLTNHALPDRLSVWHERFTLKNQSLYNTLLALEDNKLLGFICILLDADETWGALIDNLHILPDMRSAGIGRL